MPLSVITLKNIEHRGGIYIALFFDYNASLISRVKKIEGSRWSQSNKCWYIPYRANYLNYLQNAISDVQFKDLVDNKPEILSRKATAKKYHIDIRHNENEHLLYIKAPFAFKEKIKKLDGARWHAKSKLWIAFAHDDNFHQIDESISDTKEVVTIVKTDFSLKNTKKDVYKSLDKLTEFHKNEIKQFERWLIQKRYSGNTVKTYKACMMVFFRYYSKKPIREISNKDIELFNFDFLIKHGYSSKTQNQYISAIKTFFLKMKDIKHDLIHLERPIKSQKLPKVIPIEDVQAFLAGIPNIKHKTALTTIYSLGLRRSELLNLKIEDIDFKRDMVMILNAKGKRQGFTITQKVESVINNILQAGKATCMAD